MDENEELNLLLDMAPPPRNGSGSHDPDDDPPEPKPRKNMVKGTDVNQWQVGGNGTYRPATRTVKKVPAGAYSVRADNLGVYLEEQPILSDEIVRLPESASVRVLEGIQKFWKSRKRYAKHGLVFKRGVLLWGPTGSGKTVTVHLIMMDLIAQGGIVLFCGPPGTTLMLMACIRRIEPERPLIVVLEDIDEIIAHHGEHNILSMLDGEHQIDNAVYVATTNYPERLGARIVNRPSRFDDRILVGMPSFEMRVAYLTKAMAGASADVEKWAKDTDGLSVAHLRELVAAVLCLDQDYETALSRLRTMNKKAPVSGAEYKKSVGFDGLGSQGGGVLVLTEPVSLPVGSGF